MYTSLDEIIKSLMVQLEAPGDQSYLRFFEIARQGLKELSFDATRHITTSLLTVNTTTNSVTLPNGYINMTKLGVHGDDGEIHYLVQRDNLYIGDVAPANLIDADANDTDLPIFYEQLGTGRRYGKGGGQSGIGYYRINKENNSIDFASGFTFKEIVLEYISDGMDNLNSDSNVQIHSFASEALKSYIYWNSIRYKRDYQAFEKQSAKKEYYNEKRLARARMQNFTKDEALVQSRLHIRQSPKI